MYESHTCDRFADNFNHKIAKFNSKYWVPSSNEVDVFALDWSNENTSNWLISPVTKVCAGLKHVYI